MKLDTADVERFEDMAHRLEMSSLWVELAALLSPGVMVLPTRFSKGIWRALPIAHDRSKEQDCTTLCRNLLRAVTGNPAGVFTVNDVRRAQHEALNMLKVFAPRVES